MGLGAQADALVSTDTEKHRVGWDAAAAAADPEAQRLARGKQNLPVEVSMEPALQEAQAQSPHMLPAVIWRTMCTVC